LINELFIKKLTTKKSSENLVDELFLKKGSAENLSGVNGK